MRGSSASIPPAPLGQMGCTVRLAPAAPPAPLPEPAPAPDPSAFPCTDPAGLASSDWQRSMAREMSPPLLQCRPWHADSVQCAEGLADAGADSWQTAPTTLRPLDPQLTAPVALQALDSCRLTALQGVLQGCSTASCCAGGRGCSAVGAASPPTSRRGATRAHTQEAAAHEAIACWPWPANVELLLWQLLPLLPRASNSRTLLNAAVHGCFALPAPPHRLQQPVEHGP